MSYEFYKIIHILGLVLLFFSLGALIFHSLSGGEKKFALRKFLMIQHGIGLLLVLTGGFGLLARTDAQVTEVWVIIKIMIWFCLGGIPTLGFRLKSRSLPAWFATLILAAVAVSLVILKPS